MNAIQKALTVRFSTEEYQFVADLAEANGISSNHAVRLVIQTAISDGRDNHRLAALEGRLDRMAADTDKRLADVAEKLTIVAQALAG